MYFEYGNLNTGSQCKVIFHQFHFLEEGGTELLDNGDWGSSILGKDGLYFEYGNYQSSDIHKSLQSYVKT